jgi:Dolichyl-phosphate-mannose-protein mannosyltransferase
MMFFYVGPLQMVNSIERFEERVSAMLNASCDLLEEAAGWMQRHQVVLLSIFSICYFVAMFALAQRKLFWFDELFTYYLTTLPSMDAVVAELAKGVDHHPPSYFLLMRAASSLWPDPHVSFRIPSIVGYWLLSISLFRFVTRRTSAVYGTTAMLAPYVVTHVWAADARPYGPAVGLLAVGFAAWQSATLPAKRSWSLILLAVGIAGAISTSYYAVLALVPLGIAELIRTVQRRTIDLPMWLAMGAGAAVSLLYLPLVIGSVSGFDPYNWARPSFAALLGMYEDFFESAIWFWLGCLLFVAVLVILQRWARKRKDGIECELPAAEVALGAGLLLLPVLGLAVALAVTKTITTRYVISTVTGFSMLVAFLAFRAARGSAIAGLAIASATLLSSMFSWHLEWRAAPQVSNRIKAVSSLLDHAPDDTASLPVVFESPMQLFEVCHYSDRALTERFVFLVDPESALFYSGTRYTGHGLTSLQRYAPMRTESFASFRQAHPRFLLYETPWLAGYVLPKLLDEGAQLRLLGRQGSSTALYLVD